MGSRSPHGPRVHVGSGAADMHEAEGPSRPLEVDAASEIASLKGALAERERQIEAIHRITAALYAQTNLDGLVVETLKVSMATVDATAGSIMLRDAESGKLVFRYVVGEAAEALAGYAMDPRLGIAGEVLQTGVSRITDDVSQDANYNPAVDQRSGFHTRNMVTVPLKTTDGDPFGVMQTLNKASGLFSDHDLQVLTILGHQAATAIESARLHEEVRRAELLQAVGRERSLFMRTVAHELRSPMAAILGNLKLVLDGYLGEVSPKVLTMLQRAHQRGTVLVSLVNDLLALVAGQERSRESVHECVCLDELARQAADDAAGTAQAKSIEMHTAYCPGPVEVSGDRDQLLRLLDNLVSNAVKYTPDGGHVRVALDADERQTVFVVEDTGIGIPKAIQATIFDEFVRAENAKQFTENGTGLGLAIVKRIAEGHGATVVLESEEGQGTRIRVTFPRLAPQGTPSRKWEPTG